MDNQEKEQTKETEERSDKAKMTNKEANELLNIIKRTMSPYLLSMIGVRLQNHKSDKQYCADLLKVREWLLKNDTHN